MVKRRGFMGMLASVPFLGGGVKDVVQSGIKTSSISSGVSALFNEEPTGSSNVGYTIPSKTEKRAEQLLKIGKLKARNALLRTMKPKWWIEDIKNITKQEALRETYFSDNEKFHSLSVDCPHVHTFKSVSAAGKFSMIYDRKLERIKFREHWQIHDLEERLWEYENEFD